MKNKTNNKFAALRCWLSRLVRFEWLPEPSFVRIRKLNHDDIMVSSSYRSVMLDSYDDWIAEFVENRANDCLTDAGRKCCLGMLKTHVEAKTRILSAKTQSPTGRTHYTALYTDIQYD